MYLSRARRTAVRMAGCLILAFAASQLLATPIITTVAGHGAAPYAADGGSVAKATLDLPTVIAVAPDGTGYIFELGARLIRRVDPKGIITTYAGNGFWLRAGNHIPATQAGLGVVVGMAADASGNLYLTEQGYNVIRKVAVDGTISDVAGMGAAGYSGDNGPAPAALLNGPTSLATDAARNLYIVDAGNQVIRKLAPDGTISTLGGTGHKFGIKPDLVSVDPAGRVFLLDRTTCHTIAVNSDGTPASVIIPDMPQACTFYGSNSDYWTPPFNPPYAFGVDAADNLYIAANDQVRQVTPSGAVSFTSVVWPGVLAVAPNGTVYFTAYSATAYPTIETSVYRWVPGQDAASYAGSATLGYSGDGGPAAAARFAIPSSIAAAPNGDYYVLDVGAAVVRKVSAQGQISTVAGNGQLGNGLLGADAGGSALSASIVSYLGYSGQLARDGAGSLYVADYGANQVQKVDGNGIITLVAGNGAYCYDDAGSWSPCTAADGQPANKVSLRLYGIAADQAGNLYLATLNRIWKVTADGILHAFAGTGATGYAGDGGPALQARMNGTSGLNVDPHGNVYFQDYHASPSGYLSVIRKIDTSGTITTIPGSAGSGYGISNVDGAGNIYGFANGAIVEMDATGHLTVIADASGTSGYSGDNGPAAAATYSASVTITLDAQGNLLLADAGNQVVRKITLNPPLQVSVTANGSDSNLQLTASLVFAGSDAGKTENLYVAAKTLNGAIYFKTPAGWQPYDYQTAQPLFGNTVLGTNSLVLLDGSLDVSTLVGTTLFVGYGADTADLFSPNHFQQVYTIQ